VQLHGANGYLIDQFLRDGTNLRDDDMAARSRTACACCARWWRRWWPRSGADRTHVRLSPNGAVQGCDDSDPASPVHRRRRGLRRARHRQPRAARAGHQSSFLATDVPPVSPHIRRCSAAR
jgi:N-ethylmaleimide reductase